MNKRLDKHGARMYGIYRRFGPRLLDQALSRGRGELLLVSLCAVFLQLQIWDTAGQERFRTITQSYYRSANGAILAYDISKRGSFLSIPRWIEDVRKYAGSNIVQLLIGELDMSLLV